MKYLVPASALLLLATVACTNGEKKGGESPVAIPEVDTVLVDWTETSAPMPVLLICEYDDNYNVLSRSLRHAFDSQGDSLQFTPLANTYKTLYAQAGKFAISYAGKQEGKEMGARIEGKYSYCMKGLNYDYKGDGDVEDGFAFNDEFLQNHEIIDLKFPQSEAPKSLVDTLEARYGNKVLTAVTSAISADGNIALYSVQMTPKDGKCLGMRVVSQNNVLSIYEDWSMNYDEESAWHVDDGGEYAPMFPYVITRGEKGLDIFYFEGAPESSSYQALLQRADSMSLYCFSQYYNYVDYCPTPDPVDLPKEAVLQAELDGYRVWINTDIEQSEDNMAGQYSVYYSKPNEKEVYRLVTTGQNPDAYKKWDSSDIYVPAEDVQIAENAYLAKTATEYPEYYLILQGCPDARNVMTYIISLPHQTIEPYFRWLRVNEGYLGMDESGKLLKFSTYRYGDEGRYSVCQYYDFNWNLVKEEPIEE